MRSRIPVGFSDLLVGVFLAILIGTMTIVEVSGAREVANRAKCASNLHQIGLAILLYQNENNQLMPRTVMDTTDDPKPVWGTPYEKNKEIGPILGGDLGGSKDADPFAGGKAAPDANDVSASFYLLLRCEQLTPAVFICPSSKARSWDFGGGANSALCWTNWNGLDGISKHLSYSYQNPFISKAALEAGYPMTNLDATFAVAADINPGGTAVTSLKIDASAEDMKKGNSPNHAQDGQNVLYGDGHAEWQNNPFCGSRHDNIYTAGGPEIESDARKTATVMSSPVDRYDSILLPSLSDGSTPLTPEQIAKLSKDIQGQYTTMMHGYHAVLSIDDKTIQWMTGPLTVKYDYKITGADGQGLQLALTAPDTTATAVASLNDKDLHIEMSGEFTLNFPWKRVEKK
jgi:prepilin-type processing-associated H-X9-DG protein